MRIANLYNHLNGHEYLMVHREREWNEIVDTITSIDANQHVKVSRQRSRQGRTLYDQTAINRCFEELLYPLNWQQVRTPYYVTGDIDTAKEIAGIRDMNEQRALIQSRRSEAYATFNEVDFVKNRIAVEVQFGKYFSVAYDLHVKHTFFYFRDDIDVGIEIIPTRAMSLKMDSGVAWFEKEVANVIREGRSNPAVPIVIIGIEPEHIDI